VRKATLILLLVMVALVAAKLVPLGFVDGHHVM
jgi:hypothetical protein